MRFDYNSGVIGGRVIPFDDIVTVNVLVVPEQVV